MMKGNAMKRLTTLLVMVALAAFASSRVLAQEALSNEELLLALDDVRFFDAEVNQIEVSILSETPDETRDATIRLQFAELEDGTYSRIEFVSPEELAGQLYLNTPDAAYFFGPDLDFPIKTSATTEVFGDTAVAQTSGIRFADKYTIEARRESSPEDGLALLELDLVAVDFTVAFQAITLIVDTELLRPISMTLFALSGLPFYEVGFEEYATREETDDTYVTTQRIENLLLVGRSTLTEIVALGIADLSASLFDPAAL